MKRAEIVYKILIAFLIAFMLALAFNSCRKEVVIPIDPITEKQAIWDEMKMRYFNAQGKKPLTTMKAIIDTSLAGRFEGFGHFDYDLSVDTVYETPADSIGLQGLIYHGHPVNGIIRSVKKLPDVWYAYLGFDAIYQGQMRHFAMFTRLSDLRTFTYIDIEPDEDLVNVQVYPGYQHVFVLNYNPSLPNSTDQTAHSRVRVQGSIDGQLYEMDLQRAYKIVFEINKGRDEVPLYGNEASGDTVAYVSITPTTITQLREETSIEDYGRFKAMSIYDIINDTVTYDAAPCLDNEGLIYNLFYWKVTARIYLDGEVDPIKGTIHQKSRFEGITDYITGVNILGGTSADLASGTSPTYITPIYTIQQ